MEGDPQPCKLLIAPHLNGGEGVLLAAISQARDIVALLIETIHES